MSYGVYILLVGLALGVSGFLALTTHPVQQLLQSTVGHPRRSALVALAAALVLGMADVVGVLVFAPEYEHVGHSRSWPPGSISFLSLFVAYGAVWVAVTGRPLVPPRDAPVRGSSLFRMARLFMVLVIWAGMTGLSWTYLLNRLRARVAEPEPTSTRPSAASQVDAAMRETLDAMHFGECYATPDCSGAPMPARASASTCIRLGGRGWQEAPDGCMAPSDWTPPTP